MEIIEEYLRVLAYPKFDLSEREIDFLLNHEILPYFKPITVKPGNWKIRIEADPSDDMFIRCALTGVCHTIISGDRHLLETKTVDQIRIVSVSRFLEELETNR